MKFLTYLSEAPIRIDLQALRTRLERAFRSDDLIDGLNKEFKKDDITFSTSIDPGADDTINAFTFPETLEIDLTIGVKLFTLSDKELINNIIETMQHELVHKEQLRRSGGKSYTVSMENIDASNIDKYISDKAEIMAYAVQIVTTLRNENYSDNQILAMLKNPSKWENKIVKSRSHLELYMDIFKKNSYQIKRLKKQIVQYIGE